MRRGSCAAPCQPAALFLRAFLVARTTLRATTRSDSHVAMPLLPLQLLLLLLGVVLVVMGTAVVLGEPPPPAAPRVSGTPLQRGAMRGVERLVRRWAPLVWLSPGERFMPAGVEDFLQHVTPRDLGRARAALAAAGIPQGPRSATWFLVSNASVEELLRNSSSFLYGRDPSRAPVPVYAVVTMCGGMDPTHLKSAPVTRDLNDLENEIPVEPVDSDKPQGVHMHVTYWMFFPYNEGKPVCVLDLGPLGPWPLPLVWGVCMGTWRRFGAHVGDWEHISLFFSGRDHPDAMYVSAHEAGAFYRWAGTGHFVLERQEVRRGSELLQRAAFPSVARLHRGTGRPELFAAQGSHGLWAQPGSHRYVRVPRLYDHSGYGAPWRTWERLAVLRGGGSSTTWMRFLGRWGNPRSGCHPLSSAICRQSDGPTGIPLKDAPFSCPPAPAPGTRLGLRRRKRLL